MKLFVSYLVRNFSGRWALLAFLFLLSVPAAAQQSDEEEYESEYEDWEEPSETLTYDHSTANYGIDKIEMRQVPGAVVDSLKSNPDFAYASDSAYWKKRPVRKSEGESDFWAGFNRFFKGTWPRVIFYSLLIAFFIFVFYRIIVVNNLYLFYRKRKTIKAVESIEETSLHSDDLEDKIRQAIQQKEWRLATRLLYLKTLKRLSDAGWIQYNAQATNYEYVMQMNKRPVAGEFRFLTQAYDYIWYGEFPVSPEQFDRIHNSFNQFYSSIRS